jgi:hypothetical protein
MGHYTWYLVPCNELSLSAVFALCSSASLLYVALLGFCMKDYLAVKGFRRYKGQLEEDLVAPVNDEEHLWVSCESAKDVRLRFAGLPMSSLRNFDAV